jgi:hypothetical protein
MKTIWILYEERYDSYELERILGVYTTEEKANQALSICPPSSSERKYGIYEERLDFIPNNPNNGSLYSVEFNKTCDNSNTQPKISTWCPFNWPNNTFEVGILHDGENTISFFVWEKSPEEAIKSASLLFKEWQNQNITN